MDTYSTVGARGLVAGIPCHASATVIHSTRIILLCFSIFPKLSVHTVPGQRQIDSMTTTKGLFDRFVDRLDFLVMGDRSKARTSDAVLNIVTAAGFVSRLVTLRALAITDY